VLLEKGASVNTAPSDAGTPLLVAAKNGHIEVVRLLLEKGAAVNEARTTDGLTSLITAADRGHLEVVQLLLEKGAAVNQARSYDGTTALIVATEHGSMPIVRLLLLKGAAVNQSKNDGRTALFMGSYRDQIDLVRCAFSAEIYTRGCHWIPRLLASSEQTCAQWHSSRKSTFLTSSHCKLRPTTEGAAVLNKGCGSEPRKNR
jgi:ankyrin repeat protein